MSKQERKRKTSLGVLFWIAAILLILVVFLFNRRNIEQVMDTTGLVEIINQRIGVDDNPDTQENQQPEAENTQEENETGTQVTNQGDDGESAENSSEVQNTEQQPEQTDQTDEETQQTDPDTETQSETTAAQEQNTTDTPAATETETSYQERTRQYQIYLVHLAADGGIDVSADLMDVRFVSSPLRRTLETLITQPEESSNGSTRNLIPTGSEILDIWIEDGVAFIDFNEAFRFNPIGMEGHILQLEQVVRTACQFPTVDAVQFLIEGELVDFLGGEGTYIGEPISPADFD